PEQVIEELEAWYQAGIMAVFLVDDNVIGNRKALVPILEAIAEWQKSKSYLVALHTEASINLADDDELLELFVRANIRTVFVGIETPNSESLRETRKMQNIERGSRKEAQEEDENSAETFLLRQIHKIQSFGIKVTCGLIVGFDSDPKEIFEIQRRFIEKSAITQAMVGLLSAIPKTPLHERLQRENRLDLKDPPDFGTNVIPLRMSREFLAEGYLDLIDEIYSPETYFERLNDLYVSRRFYQHAEDVR
ncbi:MAG TPA: B12-binding domain-containing radical SAM protein, partial [Methylococcaceae bacterium]|nr:B12-binding domain-containing radical SAM protein [Methylococcaceae bacterium]